MINDTLILEVRDAAPLADARAGTDNRITMSGRNYRVYTASIDANRPLLGGGGIGVKPAPTELPKSTRQRTSTGTRTPVFAQGNMHERLYPV